MTIPPPLPSSQTETPKTRKPGIWVVLFALATGLAISLVVLPAWLPGMVNSIAASDLRVFWYLSRASAILAYLFLWLSMTWGLLMTTRLVKIWPGFPSSNNLHKFFALFGLGLGVLHGLLLLGDKFMNFKLVQLLLPFANTTYRPTWVGFGQISLYLWGLIVLSFYLRKKIGQKTWRWLHVLTFFTYGLVLLHGITSGSDSGTPLMKVIYWSSAIVIVFLLTYRLLAKPAPKNQPALVRVRRD
jgi:predicted ferric reductase